MLKLIKFQNWTTFGYNGTLGVPMQQVNLASVGAGSHTVKLACQGNQIAVYFDSNQMMSVTDIEAQPYGSGGVSAGFWTDAIGYSPSVDDVTVTRLANDDSFTATHDTPLTVGVPGVQGNDTAV